MEKEYLILIGIGALFLGFLISACLAFSFYKKWLSGQSVINSQSLELLELERKAENSAAEAALIQNKVRLYMNALCRVASDIEGDTFEVGEKKVIPAKTWDKEAEPTGFWVYITLDSEQVFLDARFSIEGQYLPKIHYIGFPLSGSKKKCDFYYVDMLPSAGIIQLPKVTESTVVVFERSPEKF